MAVLKSFRLLSDGTATRHETFKGKDYLVVPVVALVQGVLWPVNSPAPDLVLEEEFARAPQGWNGRPVFCGHPQRSGEPVSGNIPEVLENEQIGIIFNTAIVNHKLAMEAWLDTERCAEMGGEVQSTYERAEALETVEISVGVMVTAEESSGEYQGQEYESVWRDLVPDHLALLPEGDVGACSVEMGCGVRTAQRHPRHRIGDNGFTVEETPMPAPAKKVKTLTERTGVRPSMSQQLSQILRAALTGMSDVQVREELLEALASKEPSYAWIECVYDDEFVYSVFPATGDIEYYARSYTLDESKREATVSDTRRQVEPMLTYPAVDASEEPTGGVTTAKKNPIQRLHDHAHSHGATCVTAAAAETPPCGCGGGHAPTAAETNKEQKDMDKKTRIKALIDSPHNPFTTDDAAYLESASDERLTTLEANDKATKELAEKAAAPPPAPAVEDEDEDEDDETELTEEQFLQRAPASIKSAMSRLQKQDAEHKTKVVKVLVGAQKEYNEQELNAMPIESLERMVRVCKAAVPEPDYSGRGTARTDDQPESVPAPPDLNQRVIAARAKQPATTR